MLSGPAIAGAVRERAIIISPFHPSQVNSNSYNMRLANKLLVYTVPRTWRQNSLFDHCFNPVTDKGTCDPYGNYPGIDDYLDMAKDNPVREVTIPETGLVIVPGELYLGSTVEYTEVPPPYVPAIEGRSSVGRIGLQVHITAGFGDCGFKGTWTLEMTTVYPLRIYPGVAVCQIAFERLEGEPLLYAGKYQGQRGPRASGLWRDFIQAIPPKTSKTT